jgi:hypothetical protein
LICISFIAREVEHFFVYFLVLYSEVLFKKANRSQVLVAYTCIPSYSGGRDQEDLGSKPALANSS